MRPCRIIFSELPKGELREHLGLLMARAAKAPDQGSEFEELTRDIRHLPDRRFLVELLARGYDSIIAMTAKIEVTSYVAFQRHNVCAENPHGTEWHIFLVRSFVEGKGLGKANVEFFVWQAEARGLPRVCLWGEDRKQNLDTRTVGKMKSIFGHIATNRPQFPFEILASSNGYIEFLRPAPVIPLHGAVNAKRSVAA